MMYFCVWRRNPNTNADNSHGYRKKDTLHQVILDRDELEVVYIFMYPRSAVQKGREGIKEFTERAVQGRRGGGTK